MTQTTNPNTQGQMVRPRDGRVIAGVALAVAERLGLSVGAVRLIWFIAAFFGGLGVLLYIAGWILIPEEDASTSIAEDVTGRIGDLSTWLGVALIAIATISLVSTIGWIDSDLAWAVALLAIGVLLYRGHLGEWISGPERPTSGEVSADDSDAAATDDPVGIVEPEAPKTPVASRRRERSVLGRLTVGSIFIVLGAMLVLDTADVIRPAFSHYMAVAVAIVGAGLIVGAVFGRARGLIALGLALVPLLVVSSVVTASFDGGWGDPIYRPASEAEVEARYNLSGGELELDLRRIDPAGGVIEVEGDVGFGRLYVLVPAGVGLDVTAHVGFGDMSILGEHNSGVDLDRQYRIDGDGLFELDLDVGFGQIEIQEVTR